MKKIKWYWIPIIGFIITVLQDVDNIHDDFFEEKEDYWGSAYVHITTSGWGILFIAIQFIKLMT